MIDRSVLEELQRLSDAATPGEWTAYRYPDTNRWGVESCDGLIVTDFGPDSNRYSRANAQLVAAMRNALPALLAAASHVIEEATDAAELRALRERLTLAERDRRRLATAIWLAWGVKTSPVSPVTCVHCHRTAERVECVEHASDCPVLLARRVVGEVGGG